MTLPNLDPDRVRLEMKIVWLLGKPLGIGNCKQLARWVKHPPGYFLLILCSRSPPVPKLKPRHVTSEFLFTNCDGNEIVMSIKSQSCEVDEVSLKVVKATKIIVIPILTHLINLSLEEGTSPERLLFLFKKVFV